MTACLLRMDNFSGSACWLELEYKWITVTLWKCPSYSEARWGNRPLALVHQSPGRCRRRGSCLGRGGPKEALFCYCLQQVPAFAGVSLPVSIPAPPRLPLQSMSSQGYSGGGVCVSWALSFLGFQLKGTVLNWKSGGHTSCANLHSQI